MRKTILLVLVVVSAVYGLSGCGGGASAPAGRNPAASPQVSGSLPGDSAAQIAAWDAEWQAILQDPGEAGVDFDPRKLTVSYRPLAKTPSGLGVGGLAPHDSAAAQPNACLRQNSQYEAVADAIAARFGLKIGPQVYVDNLNLTGFVLPDGADGDAVIADIRREFATVVESATYSRLYYPAYTPNDPDYVNSTGNSGPQWGHHKVHCADAWDFTLGTESVRIAVLDTGVRLTHQELEGQLLGPDAFPSYELNVSNWNNPTANVDDHDGHGTFIAGLVVAIGNNARSITGIAPGCKMIPIKISDGGTAPDASIIAGMILADELGAQVINLSWGGYSPDPNLRNAVNTVYGHGRLFVAAAGNENVTDAHYPSEYRYALSVGATDKADARSSFSNYSSGVDIAAPGEGLKSCGINNDASYEYPWQGTSFSAPIVAAGAALLLSANSALTVDDLWNILLTTGAPTTGFTLGTVPRLDMAEAMLTVGAIQIDAPEPAHMVNSGMVSLTPQVVGQPDRIEASVDSELVETLTAAPWDFNLDTSMVEFGTKVFDFRAVKGPKDVSASVGLLIDNSPARYPILEDFQDTNQDLAGLDLKAYPEALLTAAKTIAGPGPAWTTAALRENGPAYWNTSSSYNAYLFGKSAYCGTASGTYGAYETDALISRQINLNNATTPTLVFYQSYNLEDAGAKVDRGSVLVYDVTAETFTIATLKAGGQAIFSGYQASYVKTEVDLSPFAGQQVRLVFLMESDSGVSGAQAGAPAGWWIDNVAVVRDYLEQVPVVDGVEVPTGTAYGAIPKVGEIQVGLVNPQRVVRATYILDLAPLGVTGANDITINVADAPWGGVISVPSLPNQVANLRVQYFDASDVQGPEIVVPVYVFNLRGDINADNLVDQADVDALPAKLGLTSADAGYVPFYDSNLDGVITEADAAAVGYNWGASIH